MKRVAANKHRSYNSLMGAANMEGNSMYDKDILKDFLLRGISQTEAFEFFDRMETVGSGEMRGLWKGEELRTGHPMEGILTASNWYGKEFINDEHVQPLVFQKKNGELFSGNPGLMPLNISYGKIPEKFITIVMGIFRPILKTKKSRARLRQILYRGKISAAMVYDQKGIIDVFRKVDDVTVLGVMDMKNQFPGQSYFFVLKKVITS
ncbi:DUF4334 domain-containing protein [Peribacillus muralis]|uniref:DUF4334 domain-containing protein n=1 Tax=Peribacillus muralis TaxID=264697 RepID=UPI0037F7A899